MVWRSPKQGIGKHFKNMIKDFEELLAGKPFEKLGAVTNGDIMIDGNDWQNISEWKERYDTAIEKYFNNYLPE